MKIIEATGRDGWNDFIADSQLGDILQTWEWGEAKRGELWGVRRIQAVDGGRTVGQMQILTRSMPLGFKLYYAPRGPVLDYTSPQMPEILAAMMDWAKIEATKDKALMVRIEPAVELKDSEKVVQTLRQLSLKPSFRSVQMQHTRIVDLDRDDTDLLQSFDKDTRNLIRRAAKEGVVVDKAKPDDGLKHLRAFHNMYTITAQRGKFPPRPWNQFTRLWELMGSSGMMNVYVASFEEQPLAGAIMLRIGPRGYYLWAGSRRDTQKKFATYALQWAMMQDMKNSGIKLYDMWGIPPTDDPTHPWAGVGLFKKGFNGRQVDYIGDFDLPLSPTYPLFTTADRVRQRVFGQRV